MKKKGDMPLMPFLPKLLTSSIKEIALHHPGGSEAKASACNVGDLCSIPGSGRSSGEGNGNSLQYSFLENPTDRGAWWATVHGVTKSRTRLSDLTINFSTLIEKDVFGLGILSRKYLTIKNKRKKNSKNL